MKAVKRLLQEEESLLSDAALSDRIIYNNYRKHKYKGLFDSFT